MSRDDAPATAASARVVEQSYLALQDKLRKYRLLDEFGRNEFDDEIDNPTLALQQEVETFFELIRPYVEGEPGLREYWEGSLAVHPERGHSSEEEAIDYYRRHSVGIWQRQRHRWPIQDPTPTAGSTPADPQEAVADGGRMTLRDWADALNIGGLSRLVGVMPQDGSDERLALEYRFSVLGLREIADWTTEQITRKTPGDGFMAAEESEQTHIEPEQPQKVETGARMLIDVARELGAIARYDVPDTREAGFDYSDLI